MKDQTKTLKVELSDAEAMETVAASSVAMVLTNTAIHDNPIVYVNAAFERMTGYSRSAAIGRNCRFLQCPDTDPADVAALRRAIEDEREISIDLLNQRADGSRFRNRLLMSPIRDSHGQVQYFLGIQQEITDSNLRDQKIESDRALNEIQHRVKNHLSMIVGLIRVQSRKSTARAEFDSLSRRVESLQLLYEELMQPNAMSNREVVDAGAYLTRIANAIAHLDGRAGVRVNIDTEAVEMEVDTATRVGLIVSEVLTNALQHAFTGRHRGLVHLRVTRLSNEGLRVSISDDGIGFSDGAVWPNMDSMGGRIVTGLIDGLSGTLDVTHAANGTVVTLDVPPIMRQ
ncbi:hypothetical protein LCGC14_2052800 [marine sediment metagenome]|uniref:PAS domain-containing protein n=1 Tax=marine sediment metagenome TaxID=412755 RepID=A0A0F9HKH2_9ZZZZ